MRDWETESAKMGSIYQNSYITISATTSGDGSARCLSERRKPVKIPYENTTKKEYALRARKVLDHHPNAGPARPIGPLSTRCWALQEHVLSTRVLHYTAAELLFECKTAYRCECSPESKSLPTTPSLIPKAMASKKKDNIWQVWQRVVEQYSSRKLTVSGDKLPAISGIASQIRTATHSQYLAGLWTDNLVSDLLWSSNLSELSSAECCALDTWRAPSFSWASLDTAITYVTLNDEERETFTPTITIVTTQCTSKGLNPLGTISDASVVLRGPSIQATISSEQVLGKWIYTLLMKGTSSITITHDCLLSTAEIKTEKGEKQTTLRRAKRGDDPTQFQAPVMCLSVARYDNVIAGLVLGASERNPDAWERVGTFAAGTEAMQKAEEKELLLI
jgi:hypothetical protein